MDIAAYLQCFENSMASYTGDDPLDSWDKFVNFLEQKLPAGGGGGISLVLDTLVQRFLSVERYANDVRFVNYCIRCAGFYSDPVALYGLVFGRGVGTRAAVLYVNWAQQFEQKGMMEQADAVYQKALENRAQPADAVLHEYRQFQTRTRGQPQPPVPAGDRAPLQDQSNWMSSHRESPDQNKPPVDRAPAPPPNKTTVIVSRSETSGSLPSSSGAGAPAVPGYLKDELVCPGSEWSFEEVRAHKYFRKVREQQEAEQREQMESRLRQQEDEVWRIRSMVDQINQDLEIYGASAGTPQQVWRPPSAPPSSRRSLAVGAQAAPADGRGLQASHHPSVTPDWTTHLAPAEGTAAPAEGTAAPAEGTAAPAEGTAAPAEGTAAPTGAESLSRASPDREGLALHRSTCQDASQVHERSAVCRDGSRLLEPDERLDVTQGGAANLSHVTPNSSLGFVQATPSRVLPSPTVNTREALGVIMDMFQAPTFVEEPFSTSQLHAAGGDSRDGGPGPAGCTSSLPKPPAATPFTIFQDGDGDKENCRAAAPPAAGEPRPPRPLAEVAAAKADRPNDTPPELAPDESTMWGARYNSLHCLDACPNSTTDFALLARYVSTPSTHKGVFYQDQENGDGGDADDNAFTRCQTKKLSPIIEQSPRDDEVSRLGAMVRSSERLGTIVGEGHGLTSSSLTMAQPPPHAALSFRDHTLAQPPPHAALSFRDHTLAQPPPHAALSFRDHTLGPAGPGWEVYTSPGEPPQTAPFRILEDSAEPPHPEPAPAQASDVPMSPECPLKAGWFPAGSPEAPAEADLDAFLSPCRPRTRDRTSTTTWDVPMSPPPLGADVPMSPLQPLISTLDEPMRPGADVSMTTGVLQLVSDPWDAELIAHLLSSITPSLTAHPRCISWQRGVPSIGPKMTISMGKASLRVDGLLGRGAFGTVYQATDPSTSEKMVLKVQKPANPWEFYINTQLDARVLPDLRHLYGSICSAHLFHDGSVMLGELYNYGTLLNAVNIYRSLAVKVMPQPLVLYFTVCILHMVEQLHAAGIVHADVKPDNFMLGDRFLDNRSFDPDSVDHGLVLIDMGQSIDMQLFPPGTAFTAKCLTSGFQCTEMLSGKPWNYQTDFFGIAGTVHCLLFGTYMQVTRDGGVWRSNGSFRRNPHSDLWQEFFHALLNVPDCSSPPSLGGLRARLASVLQDQYSSQLPALKSRLVVQLLESCRAPRR
ncbi:mitotic checkpoint serine/threonine-protein kinase BUB1 [Cololabis saira]|uniref:mitotic checkpoint serine/threonine-protein kinase BUB1 n=1 Tax=Cololabis saira TaxID=129043 RepID=UPI002AD257C4|nr:mitotic checkpoint serine/threonine-protein kinase BUB1 [Cololabis saira]